MKLNELDLEGTQLLIGHATDLAIAEQTFDKFSKDLNNNYNLQTDKIDFDNLNEKSKYYLTQGAEYLREKYQVNIDLE